MNITDEKISGLSRRKFTLMGSAVSDCSLYN